MKCQCAQSFFFQIKTRARKSSQNRSFQCPTKWDGSATREHDETNSEHCDKSPTICQWDVHFWRDVVADEILEKVHARVEAAEKHKRHRH